MNDSMDSESAPSGITVLNLGCTVESVEEVLKGIEAWVSLQSCLT